MKFETSNKIDKWVGGVITQAISADNINPCIAECGNGIKHRYPYPLHTKIGDKNNHIQHCPQPLNYQGAKQDTFDEFCKPRHGVKVKCVLDKQAVADTHFFMQQDHKRRHNGDHPKPTDLYQDKDNCLPEEIPSRIGRQGYKPRHTGRGCRRKQRVKVGYRLPLLYANGKR